MSRRWQAKGDGGGPDAVDAVVVVGVVVMVVALAAVVVVVVAVGVVRLWLSRCCPSRLFHSALRDVAHVQS